MQIDAHQHFWEYSAAEYAWIDDSMSALRRDFLPQHLKAELESNGFRGSVAVSSAPERCKKLAGFSKLAQDSPWILGVVGWIDLRSPDVRSQLKTLVRNPKLVGIRHVVQSEPDDRFLLQPEFLRGISVFGRIRSCLRSFDLQQTSSRHGRIRGTFPRQRFVLDHMAKPPIKAARSIPGRRNLTTGRVSKCGVQNVGISYRGGMESLESGTDHPYLDCRLRAFGPDRLMIGSDWPVCLVAASYATRSRL